MKKNFLFSLFFISTATLMASDDADADPFRSYPSAKISTPDVKEWSATFKLSNGQMILRQQNGNRKLIVLGGIYLTSKDIRVNPGEPLVGKDGAEIMGKYSFPRGLNLSLKFTKEEFKAELVRAGLYKRSYTSMVRVSNGSKINTCR